MGDTDLAGDEGVEEALPSEVTLARPGRGLNVELEKNQIEYCKSRNFHENFVFVNSV